MKQLFMWVCPCCKQETLDYDSIQLEWDQAYFPRHCYTCWAKWEERYNMDFTWHENVRDSLLDKVYKKFWMTWKEILEYAKTRDDLWDYYGVKLLNYVEQYNHIWTIEDCLDEFSMEDWREELDDYLNNMLFDTYDEVVEAVKEWFEKEKWVSRDKQEYAELASRFIDNKELYDISYD